MINDEDVYEAQISKAVLIWDVFLMLIFIGFFYNLVYINKNLYNTS